MAIVFQRAAAAVGQSVTIDIGAAGNNRLLIVQYGHEAVGTDDVAMGGTPSVDGKDFTLRLAKTNPDGSGNTQEIWTHDEASLGSSNGSLSVSGGGIDGDSGIRVALWYGVDDDVPTDIAFDDTTIGDSPSANIDVEADGLIIAGAGNGSSGGTASWTSPLTERIDGGTTPPNSAVLGLASAVETSAQTNKAYTVVIGGGTLRSTLLLLAFSEAPAGVNVNATTPSEFDMDDTDIDIAGSGFGASQGSSVVYLSPNSTVAGAGEVDISAAVNTWADIGINLDLTQLSAAELTSLHTMGPGARFIIVDDLSTEDFVAVTLHRPAAFKMSLGAIVPGTTTSRLTGMTGTFGGGRAEETVAQNPSTTDTDVADDGNREDVWSIEAKPLSRDSQQYDFRVLYNGLVPDTITQTPQITIGAGGQTVSNTVGTPHEALQRIVQSA